jgi:hypothetical protein
LAYNVAWLSDKLVYIIQSPVFFLLISTFGVDKLRKYIINRIEKKSPQETLPVPPPVCSSPSGRVSPFLSYNVLSLTVESWQVKWNLASTWEKALDSFSVRG